MKEGYRDGVKQRCIDPGHQVFKVFADSFELKTSESWEDGVGGSGRRLSRSGRGRGDLNTIVRNLRLADTARQMTDCLG